MEEHQRMHQERHDAVTDLLERLGIDGWISASTSSQKHNYSMFYVETAKGGNLVIFMLECGEIVAAETTMRAELVFAMKRFFKDEHGFATNHFSAEKLKSLLIEFLKIHTFSPAEQGESYKLLREYLDSRQEAQLSGLLRANNF